VDIDIWNSIWNRIFDSPSVKYSVSINLHTRIAMTSNESSPEFECKQMCASNSSEDECERICIANGMGKCMMHLSELYEMTDPKGVYFNTDTSGGKFCKMFESLSDQSHQEDWTTKSKCSKSLTHVLMTGKQTDVSTPEARRNHFRDFCQVSVQ
jgi:hypothetical protein